MAKNCHRRQPPMSFDAPANTNSREYPHEPYISRNYSHWPTFLPLIVLVYLHSNLCSGLQKKYLFCNRVLAENGFWRQIATQGHSFCDQLPADKGSMSPYKIAGLISEYSEDVATQIAKNCRQRQPHSFDAPPRQEKPPLISPNLIQGVPKNGTPVLFLR